MVLVATQKVKVDRLKEKKSKENSESSCSDAKILCSVAFNPVLVVLGVLSETV